MLQIDYYNRLQVLISKFGAEMPYNSDMLIEGRTPMPQMEVLVQHLMNQGLNPKDAQRVRTILMTISKLDGVYYLLNRPDSKEAVGCGDDVAQTLAGDLFRAWKLIRTWEGANEKTTH